jgi:hypothetical protein
MNNADRVFYLEQKLEEAGIEPERDDDDIGLDTSDYIALLERTCEENDIPMDEDEDEEDEDEEED